MLMFGWKSGQRSDIPGITVGILPLALTLFEGTVFIGPIDFAAFAYRFFFKCLLFNYTHWSSANGASTGVGVWEGGGLKG